MSVHPVGRVGPLRGWQRRPCPGWSARRPPSKSEQPLFCPGGWQLRPRPGGSPKRPPSLSVQPGPCAVLVAEPPATASAATPRPSPREPRSERRVRRRWEEISASVRDLAAAPEPSPATFAVLRKDRCEGAAPGFGNVLSICISPAPGAAPCLSARFGQIMSQPKKRGPPVPSHHPPDDRDGSAAHIPSTQSTHINAAGRARAGAALRHRHQLPHQLPNRPENTSSE